MSHEIGTGSRAVLDRGSMWWAFNAVGFQVNVYYNLINQDIQKRRKLWLDLTDKKLQNLAEQSNGETQTMSDSEVKNIGNVENDWEHPVSGAVSALNGLQMTVQKGICRDWWSLSDETFAKYNDGSITDIDTLSKGAPTVGQTFGYPLWWLEVSGETTFFAPSYPGGDMIHPEFKQDLVEYGPGPFEKLPGIPLQLNNTELSAMGFEAPTQKSHFGIFTQPTWAAVNAWEKAGVNGEKSQALRDFEGVASDFWVKLRSRVMRSFKQAEREVSQMVAPVKASTAVSTPVKIRNIDVNIPEISTAERVQAKDVFGSSKWEWVTPLYASFFGACAGAMGMYYGITRSSRGLNSEADWIEGKREPLI